jgi:hypothetical protein
MKRITVAAFCLLSSLGAFAEEPSAVPPLQVENHSGLNVIARPGYQRFFNGDMELDDAGWVISSICHYANGYDENLPGPRAVAREEGGKCLMLPSCPGRPSLLLVGREVFLPADAKIELSFDTRYANVEGSSPPSSLYVDFRRVNRYTHGMSTEERYWINGGSQKIGEAWSTYKKVFVTPREDYYRLFIQIKNAEVKKPLPDIFFDSFNLKVLAGEGAWIAPQTQVVIDTDKKVPAYKPGETIKYELKAVFPDSDKAVEAIAIDLVDDQMLEDSPQTAIVKTINVELTKNAAGIYQGGVSLSMPGYGSFSPRVRSNEKTLEHLGGDFVTVHPPVKHPQNSVGWGIGINGLSHGYQNNKMNGEYNEYSSYVTITHGTLDRHYQVLQVAGIQTDRNWNFRWVGIEPFQGDFRFGHTDMMMKIHEKYGIDVVGILGVQFPKSKNQAGSYPEMPKWLVPLCQSHQVSAAHQEEAYIPPLELWATYCRKVMERYKGGIDTWELFNEPNGWCTVDEYMAYLKTTHQVAREISSDLKIIGPCPTGDALVSRFKDWSQEIIAAGGEKYLDGFSYHPYGASNDFQLGNLFEATNTIRSLRSWLTNKNLPLYNTECFYMPNKKYLRDSNTMNDSSTLLRHMLITLGNNVKLAASMDDSQLFKDRITTYTPWIFEAIPNGKAVVLNNLSWHLTGMKTAAPLDLNKFVNSYLFTTGDGAKALGVLWDLRAAGSEWSSSAPSDGLEFLDLWGNPLAHRGMTPLTFNPIYVKGAADKVKTYLENSRFILRNPLNVIGRLFRNDLYLEAKNLTGAPFSPELTADNGTNWSLPESVQFSFQGNEYCTARLPEAWVGKNPAGFSYNIVSEGQKQAAGTVTLTENVKSYIIPVEKSPALEVTLSAGSKAFLRAGGNGLEICVKVKDANIVQPLQFHPYTGDAVEIFIDRAPFYRMDQDMIKAGNTPLPCEQYVIPAKPCPGEETVWSKRKELGKPIAKVELNEDGYSISIVIPWGIIPQTGNRYGIYGIDIEIDKIDESGAKVEKESLSGKTGVSWNTRLHYPLFRIPDTVDVGSDLDSQGAEKLVGGDFETESQYGQAEGWARTYAAEYLFGNIGYKGSRGVAIVSDDAPAEKVKCWHQKLRCQPDSGVALIIEGMIKGENITLVGEDAKQSDQRGARFFVHFYDDINEKHGPNIGLGLKKSILGSFGWKLVQCAIPVPAGATTFQVNCGLSEGVTGRVWYDNVHIKIADK